jgi:hypothetical protein
MNELVPFHAAFATTGQINVRAMMRHYAEPFSAAEPFRDLIKAIERNSTPARRSKNQAPSAALEIHKAAAGHVDAVLKAVEYLSVARMAPDEGDIRQIVAAMMMAFHAQPTPNSEILIDVLVAEWQEPDVGDPFSSPAVASAAREMWQELPSPPSISQFMASVRKHQARLDDVFQQLCGILEAAEWAEDNIKPEKGGAPF